VCPRRPVELLPEDFVELPQSDLDQLDIEAGPKPPHLYRYMNEYIVLYTYNMSMGIQNLRYST
jgi:hypothetical protein